MSMWSARRKPKSCSSTRRIITDVAMMAGWAFSVRVSAAEGPEAMSVESGGESCRMESVSARWAAQVLGKAASQGVVMPVRWTPWPVGGFRGMRAV